MLPLLEVLQSGLLQGWVYGNLTEPMVNRQECSYAQATCSPEEAVFSFVTSLLLQLACVWQDCMLPLLEVLPFSSSMLNLGRLSSSVLDLCVCC